MTKTIKTTHRGAVRFKSTVRCTCADPVRDYLDELRRYPLLSVEEEASIARQLQDIRRRLRRVLLRNHYMLTVATNILRGVSIGESRADRILETTVFDQRNTAKSPPACRKRSGGSSDSWRATVSMPSDWLSSEHRPLHGSHSRFA
jgi:hypothetical protein